MRGQKANIHIRKHTLFLKRMNICNFILYFMMNHLKLLLHTYHVQIKSSFCHFTIVPALTVIVSVIKTLSFYFNIYQKIKHAHAQISQMCITPISSNHFPNIEYTNYTYFSGPFHLSRSQSVSMR